MVGSSGFKMLDHLGTSFFLGPKPIKILAQYVLISLDSDPVKTQSLTISCFTYNIIARVYTKVK